jgi:phosphinothricin acetyltransferase
MEILPADLNDWPEIRRIYVQGIRTGHATFETESDLPDGAGWFAGKLPGTVFKAVSSAGEVVGWAALSPVSRRRAYAGVAELSIYVAAGAQRQGIGAALLNHLIQAAENAAIWTLQTSIFPENEGSIRLHQRAGFRIVGQRERIAQLDGVWRDTVLLERRSDRI